jgi:K+-sensing histidine kinase KdpD
MGDLPPWFTRRPRLTVAVAAALYAFVVLVHLAVGRTADPVALLFTLPIALLSVAFGMRTGIVAGLAGVALVVVWTVAERTHLSPVSWITGTVPLLLLGYLLGAATDRSRRAELEQRNREAAARRLQHAIDINDSVVQGLTAAKWALESGDTSAGLDIVTETLHVGQQLVSDLIRDTDLQHAWLGQASPGQASPGTAAAQPPPSAR